MQRLLTGLERDFTGPLELVNLIQRKGLKGIIKTPDATNTTVVALGIVHQVAPPFTTVAVLTTMDVTHTAIAVIIKGVNQSGIQLDSLGVASP